MQQQPHMQRYHAIDKIRGLLIANMGLGHAVALSRGGESTELWFHDGSKYTDIWAFLVRMVNHSGTPAFFLIMGLSMALLYHGRTTSGGMSHRRVVTYFITRALILIALQFTVINAGWAIGEGGLKWADITPAAILDPRGRWLFFGVLFALGTSMIFIALIMHLRSRWLLILTALILISPHIYLHFVDYVPQKTALPVWLGPLAVPGAWPGAWVLYTFIPWSGLALLGLVLGRVLVADRDGFNRLMLWAGAGLTGVYILAKAAQYAAGLMAGDDDLTLISLLHMTRYPPDALLLCYALGVNFLLIRLFTVLDLGILNPVLVTFGRTALFLYTIHLFIYAAIATFTGRNADLPTAISHAAIGLAILFPLCWLYHYRARPWFRRKIAATPVLNWASVRG